MVMDGDVPYLPQEIFANILIRLPVKSLIRFQCVCKDWKNLFKTPSFIAEHARHSTQQDSVLLFKSPRYKCKPACLCLINRDMQVLEYQTPSVHSCTIGSSNGLLCLLHVWSFILWNPATREVFQVPKAPNINRNVIFYVGFGFSPVVNDYKIVTISLSRLYGDGVYLVHVFSVSTRSWKEVEGGKLKGILAFVTRGFSFDGAIFWFGTGLKGQGRSLLSFDIATESFKLIPIPSSVHVTFESRLTKYENKLALLSKTRVESTKSFFISLWVMGKCMDTSGERCIWTKIYTSNPFPDMKLSSALTIWRNEIVIVGVTEGKTVLVSCNLHTNEVKMWTIGNYSLETFFWNYAESLVSVGDIHIEASSS
ncbi:hypothetical protein QN277_009043 [Acacia crassicarpa]|uniref:F-box domain-containing protein n=1 Tax=Acacia crassicarpa TaxID=499986 RepID=A0AAE1M820_9FABA|nr:hypothetical protein QN277_009043 [Acacia crassicarpa]